MNMVLNINVVELEAKLNGRNLILVPVFVRVEFGIKIFK